MSSETPARASAYQVYQTVCHHRAKGSPIGLSQRQPHSLPSSTPSPQKPPEEPDRPTAYRPAPSEWRTEPYERDWQSWAPSRPAWPVLRKASQPPDAPCRCRAGTRIAAHRPSRLSDKCSTLVSASSWNVPATRPSRVSSNRRIYQRERGAPPKANRSLRSESQPTVRCLQATRTASHSP